MKRFVWFGAFALLAVAWSNTPVHAQPCAGDCDGGNTVDISELITCVNIALGSADLATCTACDPDGNGSVDISELVSAVNAALDACPTPTPPPGFCGDHEINVPGEECDDGNNFGGDDCAANCTHEVKRTAPLDSDQSTSVAQLLGLKLNLRISGNQALIGGMPRDTTVFGAGGQVLFNPGEFPITLKAADLQFDPVVVTGIGCACVRAVEVPETYGPGNAGAGIVGCGDQGLSDIDVTISYDHNTTPGGMGNSGSAAGLPDDPECDDHTDFGNGLTSDACLEMDGGTCNPTNPHVRPPPAACNGPRVIAMSGGMGPRGSTLLRSRTAIQLLANATNGAESCHADRNPNGSCKAPDFGDDCVPCTEDDPQKGRPNTGLSTSGTISVIEYDAGNIAGFTVAEGQTCGSAPCTTKATGEPTDCDALRADPEHAPLSGALATGFVGFDAQGAGDTLTTTKLVAQK